MGTTIRFARLSFHRKLSHYSDEREAIERRKDALLDVIDFETDVNQLLKGTDSSYLLDKGEWHFAGVDYGENYIFGKIGKEKEEEKKIRDEEEQDYITEEDENADVARFVIELSNLVMAYEYRRNVGAKAPYRIIRDSFNTYHAGEEELDINPLIDREELSKELEAFDRITELRFKGLHPTNPSPTEYSKDMDNFLNTGGIDHFNMTAKGEELQLVQRPELMGGVGLAEEGHGTATVVGTDGEGNEKEVSTDDKPLEGEIDMAETDPRNRKKLLGEIRDKLNKLES